MRWTPDQIPDGWLELFALLPGYDPIATATDEDWFDPVVAQAAIEFFSRELRLTKDSTGASAGSPFHLQPWQAAVVATLFGWKRGEVANPVRRYREALIAIPRKNGKTELCAGIANYCLFEDGELGAEIYVGAGTRDQARLLFDAAKRMVLSSPGLVERATVWDRKIETSETGSKFLPISSDALKQHGLNPHVALIDELHVQPDDRLVEALVTAQAARRQPLMIYLTTSDHDRAGSICNETWDHAREIRDGRRAAPRFLPVIFEAADDEDWRSPEVWKRVNPNLGVSVSIDYLRNAAAKAEQLPRFLNSFKRLHLNIRTGQAEQWLPMDRWDACDGRHLELAGVDLAEHLEGRKCWVGVDLSQKHDMTCVVLVFPEDREGQRFYHVLPWFWLPEDTIRDPKRDPRKAQLWQQWHAEGLLEATPGNVVDYGRIRKRISDFGERDNIQQIGSDPWQAEGLMQDLASDGFDVVHVRQGHATLSSMTEEFETAILGLRLVHGGHAILREQARVAHGMVHTNLLI